MDVSMPDGTVVQGVPEGTTQSQLSAKYSKYQSGTGGKSAWEMAGEAPSAAGGLAGGYAPQESMETTVNRAEIGATSIPAAAANAGHFVGKALYNGTDNASDKALAGWNEQRQAQIASTPGGEAADMLGQAALPIAGEEAMLGKAATATTSAVRSFSLGTMMKQTGVNVAKGYGYGVAGGIEQPHDNETQGQLGQSALNAGATGAGFGALAGIAEPLVSTAKATGKYISKWLPGSPYAENKARQIVDTASQGQAGNAPLQAGIQKRNDLNAANPTAQVNPTAGETALLGGGNEAGGGLLDIENSLRGQGPINTKYRTNADYAARNEANKESVSGQIGQINPQDANTQGVQQAASNEVGTKQNALEQNYKPVEPQKPAELATASTTTEASAAQAKETYTKLTSEKARVDAAHEAIDPDSKIDVIPEKVSATVNKEAEAHGETDDEGNTVWHNDKQLSSHIGKYEQPDEEDEEGKLIPVKPVAVRQMLDDKNWLENYISDNIARRSETSDTSLTPKIDTAINVKNAIIQDLKGHTNIPSAIEGKSVGQAFTEAQKGTEQFYSNLIENKGGFAAKQSVNPNTGEVKEYGYSPSAVGRLYYRGKNQTASEAAVEGRNLFDPTKPDKATSTINQLANLPDKEGTAATVYNTFLSHINETGDFDKAYNTDMQNATKEAFPEVHQKIMDLKQEVNSASYTAEQRNQLISKAKQAATDDMEKSLAFKLAGKDIPHDAQMNEILKNPEAEQKAVELAKSQNDNGASLRGLGKNVLDKVRKDSKEVNYGEVSERNAKGMEFAESYNAEKFNEGITKHEDILRASLGDKQYENIKDTGDMLRIFDAAQTMTKERVSGIEQGQNKPAEAAIKGLVQKGVSMSYSALNAIQQVLTSAQGKKIAAFVDQMIADPELTLKAKLAAQNAATKPNDLSNLINSTWNITKKVVPIVNQPSYENPDKGLIPSTNGTNPSPKDKGLDNEVNKVYNEKSGKQSENTNDSSFSFVSSASADDNVPSTDTSSKKNFGPSYQVADNESFAAAAKDAGVSENYLRGLEKHEIQGVKNPATARPKDKNGTPIGDAYGWGQWKENSWNDMAKKHGLALVTDQNRYTDQDPRSDRDMARRANGYSARDNANALEPVIKRPVTEADAYVAHLTGLGGAKKLLTANPSSIAANLVPAAAKNNRHLFYGKDGNAYTVKQFYEGIEDKYMYHLDDKSKELGHEEPDY